MPRRPTEVARRRRRQAAARVADRPAAERRRDARDRQLRGGAGARVRGGLGGVGRRDRLRRRARAARPRRRDPVRGDVSATRTGDVLAMNGDELVDVDFAALLARHRATGAAATVTVAQPPSQFGQVDLTDDDVVTAFHEVARVPYWVNCGIYALSEAALARFPERGDHETTIFPELAAEGSLRAFRHDGALADREHPEGAAPRRRARDRAPGVARVSRPVRVRAASRRQALGLRADLGRGRGVRRQGALRPRRPGAQPPVPRAEGRVVARPVGTRVARARPGRRRADDVRDRRRATPSATARERCTASPRSRTRRSSRSRRRISTTSSGSTTATAGPSATCAAGRGGRGFSLSSGLCVQRNGVDPGERLKPLPG